MWGKVSDIHGRKGIFQTAIVVFLLGSFAAGAAQDMTQLIAARAVQGLGIGGIMALTQAILADVMAPRERGRYQGYLGAVFGLATVAGPLIGGFLVGHLSWRWTFYASLPVALAALAVTERVLRLPFPRRRAKVDWLGAFLIVAGVSALLLVLSLGGQEFRWASPQTGALTTAAVVLLGLAVAQERRAREPIMPPRLFANRTFVVTGLGGFVIGIAMFGGIIYLPQYLQIVRGLSPTASGLHTLPMMAGLLGASMVSGRVITRTGRYKAFPVAGMLLAALGLFLFSRLDPDTSLWLASVYMLVLGTGVGLTMQVLVLAAQNAVDRSDLGVATSGATFFRSMGGALGVAVFGALLTSRLGTTIPAELDRLGLPRAAVGDTSLGTPAEIAALPGPVREAVVTGFSDALDTVFLAGVPLALLGFAVVLLLREAPLQSAAPPGARPDGEPGDRSDVPSGTPDTASGVAAAAVVAEPGAVRRSAEPSPDPTAARRTRRFLSRRRGRCSRGACRSSRG